MPLIKDTKQKETGVVETDKFPVGVQGGEIALTATARQIKDFCTASEGTGTADTSTNNISSILAILTNGKLSRVGKTEIAKALGVFLKTNTDIFQLFNSTNEYTGDLNDAPLGVVYSGNRNGGNYPSQETNPQSIIITAGQPSRQRILQSCISRSSIYARFYNGISWTAWERLDVDKNSVLQVDRATATNASEISISLLKKTNTTKPVRWSVMCGGYNTTRIAYIEGIARLYVSQSTGEIVNSAYNYAIVTKDITSNDTSYFEGQSATCSIDSNGVLTVSFGKSMSYVTIEVYY